MPFKHGITVTEITDGSRTLTEASTAIIGLVATGPDADAAVFPLDRPALITDIEAAIGKAGTTGSLRKALRAIADQTSPVVVVVRVGVGEGANAEAVAADQTTKVIGDGTGGTKTGMQALLAAEAQLGVRPRILGAPGLDTEEVTTALIVVAKKLRGFVYAAAIGATITEAMAYRANFAAREIMLVYPDFLAFDTVANATVPSYGVARALGLRAKIDQTTGPHKTLSNVVVDGVTGLTKDIQWDLHSDTTEAALLNAKEITALVRTSSGFRFWGNRTCDDSGLFVFESTVRVAQLVADTIGEGMEWAIDKPLTPALVTDIVETINGFMRQMKTRGIILGGSCWYDPAQNSIASLKDGKLRIDYDFTVPPPLEDLGFNQRITDSYFAQFGAQLSAA
jgi:phage tail sheath protein FI